MNSKWMVFCAIALVVLLVLYVASVGVGSRERRSGEGQGGDAPLKPDLNAPWVQKLRDRLTAKLKSEDLALAGGAPGCGLSGTQLVVPVNGWCEFEIAPAKRTFALYPRRTRAIYPKLVLGKSAAFGLEQEGALQIEGQPLVAGAEAERVDVYGGEVPAALTVTGCEMPEEGEATLCRLSLE